MHKLHWSILVLGQHLALRLESWPGTEYELREDGIQSLWPSWLPASEGSRAQIPRSNVGQVAHVLLTPWVTSQKADITRRRYWGSLLALVRTLEQQQRRIATFALVHSTAEYWASVWCCSAHTHLIDPAINDVLRTVTGCLCPTPADNLPILTGIQPVELRRNGATLSLARSAMEPGHLLHSALTRPLSANARCLKSRHPFVPPHNISSVHLATTTYVRRSGQITNGMRSVDNPTRLRIFILDTGTHPPEWPSQEEPGSDLPASTPVTDVSAPACRNGVWPPPQPVTVAQKNKPSTMLSSNVQSIDLPMDCMAWRFWMMRQLNGYSTPAPRSSAAKQWFEQLARKKKNLTLWQCTMFCYTSLQHNFFSNIWTWVDN